LLEHRAAPLLPAVASLWLLISFGIWVVLLARTRDRRGSLRTALAGGLVVTFALISLRLTTSLASTSRETELDPITIAATVLAGPGELFLFLPAVWILARPGQSRQSGRGAGLALGAVAVSLASAAFVIAQTTRYLSQFERGFASLPLVRETISEPGLPSAQVYWTVEPVLIWHELGTNSYFHQVQTAGVVFSPETAAEGLRRSKLVKPFEIAQMRRVNPNPLMWEVALRTLDARLDDPPPTADDLLKLASDEAVDWIVLYDEFPGLYAATDGRVYVYDCSTLRRKTAGSDVAQAE
jgi:hypothetical protein